MVKFYKVSGKARIMSISFKKNSCTPHEALYVIVSIVHGVIEDIIMAELHSHHEDAGVHMFLQAKYASDQSHSNVAIHCSDTCLGTAHVLPRSITVKNSGF